MKNWTLSCYTHFKTPIIVEEKGEVKYQFACHMYMFSFLSSITPHIPELTETCWSSSPGNMRRIQLWTSCIISNHVKIKLLKHQRALQTMHMVQCTARLNSTTLSHCGSSNATDPSPSSMTSHYNGYCECFTQRWKPHLWQWSPKTSKKSMAFWKSKSGRFSRFKYFFSFELVQYELISGSFPEIPWTNTCVFWWMDLT